MFKKFIIFFVSFASIVVVSAFSFELGRSYERDRQLDINADRGLRFEIVKPN